MRKYNPTPEQKAKAEERRAKMRKLAKTVSEMTDEQRNAIVMRLGAIPTVEGRPLSAFNTCFLFHQLEGVSMVGGFQQWRNTGRQVRRGEHALAIWIPKGEKADDSKVAPEAGEVDRPSFFLGNVFDISQTDAIPAE
jgi:N-terminal domain of anti-restriction factor ArdC